MDFPEFPFDHRISECSGIDGTPGFDDAVGAVRPVSTRISVAGSGQSVGLVWRRTKTEVRREVVTLKRGIRWEGNGGNPRDDFAPYAFERPYVTREPPVVA